MSDDPKHGATTIHASKGGGNSGKWLAGGLVALLLAGGGYFAWKSTTPGETNTQTAYNDQYASESSRAGPLAPDRSAASSDENATAPASSSARSTTARRSTAAAGVPEETIGVTPISATTTDENSEEVFVTAPGRPVWSRVPTTRRLTSFYPEHAREVGREGEASLHCLVQGDGSLNCDRVSEFPARAGFGAAALRVADTFRHAPQTERGGDATGTPVNLRVVFRMANQPSRG
jgi:TonB family protein